MISCGILFLLWLLSKNRDWLSVGLSIHFAPGTLKSQSLLDSNLDYLVISNEVPVIEVVSCISTFKGWAWLCKLYFRLAWTNTHVFPACSFQESFSLIVHYNTTSHFFFVFSSTKKSDFYQLLISPQKPLFAW